MSTFVSKLPSPGQFPASVPCARPGWLLSVRALACRALSVDGVSAFPPLRILPFFSWPGTSDFHPTEAGRGAATIVLDLIAKWMKYDDAIDAAFNYSPVDEPVDEEGSDLKAIAVRAGIFFTLKTQTVEVLMQLIEKYLQCHGISSDGISEFGQLVLAVSRQAAKNTPPIQ
jgi:hypothetical protein